MTLINDKKISPLYGDTVTNPTCHVLDEKEFNDSIASILKEGLQKGYSKPYVAGEIFKMVQAYPDFAQNVGIPETQSEILEKLIAPLYPKAQNPVYQCTRPINLHLGLHFEGRKIGTEAKNNPLYHQYTCINPGEKKEELSCKGFTTSLPPFKAPGKIVDEEFNSQYCDLVNDSQCVSDCIEDEWAKEKPFYTLAGQGTNCQEYDNDIHEVCHDKCKE